MISRKENYEFTNVQNVKIAGNSFMASSPYVSREQIAWLNECVRTGQIRDSLNPQQKRCTYTKTITKKDPIGIIPSRPTFENYKDEIDKILQKKYDNDFGEDKVLVNRITDTDITLPTIDEVRRAYGQSDAGKFNGDIGCSCSKDLLNEFQRTSRLISNGQIIRSNIVPCLYMADILQYSRFYGMRKDLLHGGDDVNTTPDADYKNRTIAVIPDVWETDLQHEKFYYHTKWYAPYPEFGWNEYDYIYYEQLDNPSYSIGKPNWKNSEFPVTVTTRVDCTMLFVVYVGQSVMCYATPKGGGFNALQRFDTNYKIMILSVPIYIFLQYEGNDFRFRYDSYAAGKYIEEKYNLFNEPLYPYDLGDFVSTSPIRKCSHEVYIKPLYACLQARAQSRDIGS